jgi:hypothetical protein
MLSGLRLETAAKLTIDESPTGFSLWKADPRAAGAQSNASKPKASVPVVPGNLTSIPTTESSDEQRPRHH